MKIKSSKQAIIHYGSMSLILLTLMACQDKEQKIAPPSIPANTKGIDKVETVKTDKIKMSNNFKSQDLESLNKIKQDSLKKPQLVIFLRHFG